MKNKTTHNPGYRRKGFTIIELVVVVIIIATLAAIAFVSYEKGRKQARDARRVADITNLGDTSKMYFLRNGSFPTATSDLVPDYYQTAPVDPMASSGYAYGYYRDISTPPAFVVLHATFEDALSLPSTRYTGASTGFGFTCADATLDFCLKVAP